jgi:hypothetical protein
LLTGCGVAAAEPVRDGEPSLDGEPAEEEANLLDARTKWFLEGRAGVDGKIPWDARNRSLRQVESSIATGLLGTNQALVGGTFWSALGPSAVLDGSIAYSGRITSLAAHPTNSSILFAGTAQGGVWKTTDAGLTWQPLTDSQPSLAIGAVAIARSNPSILYAGTGEANGGCDSYFGAGILKSTDGGGVWSIVGGSSFSGTSISRIIVHPTNPSILWVGNTPGSAGFVCTNGSGAYGVWKSIDGGANWTRVLIGDRFFGASDLAISPTDPNRLYAGLQLSGVWTTADGGTSWTKLAGGLPTSDVARVDVAVDPQNASKIYALIGAGANSQLLGIFRSTNAGTNWSALSAPTGSCQYWSLDSLCSYAGTGVGNCRWNLVIEVAPDSGVWIGGVGLWRSGDSGSSWANVCPSTMHVDQHAVEFSSDGKAWTGNDGGVFLTTNNGTSWTNRNAGLSIAQFYPGAALHPTKRTFALGGTQDNGPLEYAGSSSWTTLLPGDGAYSVIDPVDPAMTWYVSTQFLNIRKTTDGGATFQPATTGLLDANNADKAGFISPFAMCPSNHLVLIAGSMAAWKTTNGAGAWTLNSQNPFVDGYPARAVAFAPSDATCNTYFVGAAASLFRTTTGGVSWTDIAGTVLPLISDIAVDPANSSVVYVAGGGFGGHHLYKTTNALAASPTWTATDTGLPDTPFNAILLDPDSSSTVYVGTDIGIFRSTNSGASWSSFMVGHPNVAVFDLAADSSTQSVISFTHGRGAFRLASSNPAEASASQNMTAGKGAGTLVSVTYTPACGATDHVIYWGTTPITGSLAWTNAACARGTSGATSFDPGAPPVGRAFYFVIVGQNATKEGSYGTGSSAERPEAVGVGTCDRPLDLTGACP